MSGKTYPTTNRIIRDMRMMDDSFDPRGTALSWMFGVSEVLFARSPVQDRVSDGSRMAWIGSLVPADWQFSSGSENTVEAIAEADEFPDCYILDMGPTNDELVYAGRVLNKYIALLDHLMGVKA